jgi:hypothetical protein
MKRTEFLTQAIIGCEARLALLPVHSTCERSSPGRDVVQWLDNGQTKAAFGALPGLGHDQFLGRV